MFVSYAWRCWHTPGILDLRRQKELSVIHQGHSEFKTERARGKTTFYTSQDGPSNYWSQGLYCRIYHVFLCVCGSAFCSISTSHTSSTPPAPFQLRCWNRVPNMLHGERHQVVGKEELTLPPALLQGRLSGLEGLGSGWTLDGGIRSGHGCDCGSDSCWRYRG